MARLPLPLPYIFFLQKTFFILGSERIHFLESLFPEDMLQPKIKTGSLYRITSSHLQALVTKIAFSQGI